MQVKLLNQKHPEYEQYCYAWESIEILKRGGCEIRKHAEKFLTKRPKELPEVYKHRVERFTYQNIIGTAMGWYNASLFEKDPTITLTRGKEKVEGNHQEWLDGIIQNCNRAGKTLFDFFREVTVDLMQFRAAYVLTDLPAVEANALSLADQKASGALDPYLVRYSPREVINWDTDAFGNLTWIVIHTINLKRSFGGSTVTVDRWYYFDRQECRVYEYERKDDQTEEKAEAILVRQGKHALSAVGRVPVRRIEVTDDLWLADRAYPQAIDHLNQDNTLAWALFMANLPVPVIKGEFEGDASVSETAYIHLAVDGSFEYAEPAGTSFEQSKARLDSLREELYRQFYLQAQGRSSAATPSSQSGYSKEMDMLPAVPILNAFGDVLRDGMSNVLTDVVTAHGERELKVVVNGFNYDASDPAEIESIQAAIDFAGGSSPTFRKEMVKRVAHIYLKDASEDLRRTVDDEIDKSPDDPGAEQMKQQQERIRKGLTDASQPFLSQAA